MPDANPGPRPDTDAQPSPDERPAAVAGTSRGGFTFLLIVGATFGVQFLILASGVISARVLGVEGRGVVALAMALATFAAQLSFGGSLPPAVTKLLAERRVGARDGFGAVARRRGWLLVLPALVAGALVPVLHHSADVEEQVVTALVVLVITLQTILFLVLAGGLQGEGRLVRMAWVALAPQAAFVVAVSVALVADWSWGATAVLLAYVASNALGLVLSWFALLRREGGEPIEEAALWTETRRNYVSGVRPLDGLGIERLLVGGMLGTSALGLFAAGAAVSNLCRLVSTAISVVVLPQVAQHHDDPAEQRAVVRRWTGTTFVLVALIVGGLEVVAEPVIRLAFGEEFVGAVACARWLILADGLLAIRRVFIAVLQGQGRGGVASWVELALLPVLVAGIVAASLDDSLTAVGITLAAVGGLSCLALGWAVVRGPRRVKRPVGRHRA